MKLSTYRVLVLISTISVLLFLTFVIIMFFMKNLFVSYELALIAKEKGFDEPCLAKYVNFTGYEPQCLIYKDSIFGENYLGKNTDEDDTYHSCSKKGLLNINQDDSFLVSTLIGYATDSALLGGLLGGDILGGVIGDLFDGNLFD